MVFLNEWVKYRADRICCGAAKMQGLDLMHEEGGLEYRCCIT